MRFLGVDAAREAGLPWPDTYYRPEYGAAVEESDAARWEVAVLEPGPVLVPYLLRPVDPELVAGPAPLFDIVSPYGYAGPWAPEGTPLAELRRARAALRGAWRERGVVAEFHRLSPFLPGVRAWEELEDLDVWSHNQTVRVDLTPQPEVIWSRAAGRHRTSVRKARKKGWSVEVRPVEPADVRPDSPFRRLYEGTMQRVETSAYYFFPDAYYERLLALGGDLWTATARAEDGAAGAASLFMRTPGGAHYHLSGSERDAARDGANNLMLHEAMLALREAGAAWIHLGGGVRADDALFKFKLSFGGERLSFRLARSVLDPDRYAALVHRRAEATGRTSAELEDTGYFPTYRG